MTDDCSVPQIALHTCDCCANLSTQNNDGNLEDPTSIFKRKGFLLEYGGRSYDDSI